MKIYTKTGDAGRTRLVGGSSVSKSDPRVEVYGQVDEVNSCVGVALCAIEKSSVSSTEPMSLRISELRRIQNRLFNAGSLIACEDAKLRLQLPQISDSDVEFLEKAIDAMTAELPPLKEFILPGGSEGAAHLHVCRTRCRSAERAGVQLSEITENENSKVLIYLNRLSDYFFVAARWVNQQMGIPDVPWKKDL